MKTVRRRLRWLPPVVVPTAFISLAIALVVTLPAPRAAAADDPVIEQLRRNSSG